MRSESAQVVLAILVLGSSALAEGQACGTAAGLRAPVDGTGWYHSGNPFANYLSTWGGHHPGEDWNLAGNADAGKPVKAIAPGVIRRIYDMGTRKWSIALEHSGTFLIPARSEAAPNSQQSYSYQAETVQGLFSIYLHITNPSLVGLSEGQCVSAGQTLGYIADPGGGDHLHFEIRHPSASNSPSFTLVTPSSNWAQTAGSPNGYYLNVQPMVNSGQRHPSDILAANPQQAACSFGVAQGVSGAEATAIVNAHNAVGGQAVLGCPTGAVGTGFTSWNGTNAHYQNFANGSIEYMLNGPTPGQAFAITQPFSTKWVGLGLNNGNVMGYPIANPSAQTTSCVGTPYKFQRFEGGHLEYHMGGAHNGQVYEIHGLIRSKWDALGFAGCPLGLPTSDERNATASPFGSTGRVNDLEGGHIHYRYGDSQAYATWGALDSYYASVGGSANCLGFPNADQTTSGGWPYATFEGGYVWTTNGTTFQKSCGSAASNNAFAGAQALSGLPARATGSNVGATKEAGEPNHGGNAGGASVWWSWTAPFTAAVSVSTAGSGFDTLLGVYTGSSVSSLTLVAQNDDNLPLGHQQSRVQFRALGGTTYRIAVDGYRSVSGAAATGSIALRLHAAPTADLDADGRTDILLWNPYTWALSSWVMDEAGNQVYEQALSPSGPPTSAWQLVGTNDFNNDQKTDLVYWDSGTGQVQFWLMNGFTRASVTNLTGASPLSTSWRVAATGDFNRDGWPDLLWRNTSTQKLAIWTMSGTAKLGDLVPSPDQAVDANWAVVGALDYNGDGARDLLWYNSTSGKIVFWFMNTSVQRVNGQFASPSNAGDNNWKVVAAGDYGVGTGGANDTNDILWRNETSGRLVLWFMNTAGVRTYGAFTNPNSPADATGTTVVGPK